MTWRTAPLPSNWDSTIRPYILRRDPFCMWGSIPDDRAEPGQVCERPSIEVDHIGRPTDHRPMLLRGLCVDHHKIRTGRQGAAARNKLPSLRKRPPDKHPGFKSEDDFS